MRAVVQRVGDRRGVEQEVRLVVPCKLLAKRGDPRGVGHVAGWSRRATVAVPTTRSGSSAS